MVWKLFVVCHSVPGAESRFHSEKAVGKDWWAYGRVCCHDGDGRWGVAQSVPAVFVGCHGEGGGEEEREGTVSKTCCGR